ncbi:MAG: hypothetical protein SVU32_09685, partial [Candidatus Nanohaloarchaea archaeon]|nr:hypothetical protein [Candidatus Nanohaloarchaea archaeon]
MKRHGLSLPVSKTTLYIGLAIMTAIMLSILVVNVWSTAEGAKETGITISMFRIAQTIALMQIQPTMHA